LTDVVINSSRSRSSRRLASPSTARIVYSIDVRLRHEANQPVEGLEIQGFVIAKRRGENWVDALEGNRFAHVFFIRRALSIAPLRPF